jgi:hypothetical protein
MRLRDRVEPQRYEQRIQHARWERKAETKQVDRLSAILLKKVGSANPERLADEAA